MGQPSRPTLRPAIFHRRLSRPVSPTHLVVADLGCGTGHIAAEIAPFVHRVIGVDNSAAMLKAARRRLANLSNVELRRGELTSIPIDDASCDAALIVLALTYVPDPAAAIAEAARILKPGGKVVIIDLLPHDRDDFRRQMNQHWPGFDHESVRRWLTDASLEVNRLPPASPRTQRKRPGIVFRQASQNA